MNVEELIKKLETMPKNMKIMFEDYLWGNYFEITDVEVFKNQYILIK
jgi:hypothetical protein